MITNTYTSRSAEETQKFAKETAAKLTPGTIITLSGELGSGKTTFVQGLAKGLGIENKIISPTFIIVRKYVLQSIQNKHIKHFYHIDLYRVENESKLSGLGLDEILNDKESIVAIEWSEKLGSKMPSQRIHFDFTYDGDSGRTIAITRK